MDSKDCDLENLPTPRYHYSFRITHPEISDPQLIEYYLINIKNYLKERHYNILCMTGGLHLEASHPHVHLHFILTAFNMAKTRPTQYWKDYWGGKKHIGIVEPVFNDPHYHQGYPCLVSYLHRSQCNISIKSTKIDKIRDTNPSKECPKRFLAYPLKEQTKVAVISLPEDVVKCLMIQGNGEYAVAKIKSKKELEKKQKSLGEYAKIVGFLDEQFPKPMHVDCKECAIAVLEHIKKTRGDYKDHLHPRGIINSVQKYCFHRGTWTSSEIAEQYLG